MDLIDRNELLKHQYINMEWKSSTKISYFHVVDVIDINNAPTIEAEPVKHGKWNLTEKYEEWGAVFFYQCEILCSVCGDSTIKSNKRARDDYLKNTKYCPHCGAKMDLEGEENE